MMNLAAKPGSVDLLRLFEPVDFERTLGDPSLAIEGSGLEGYLHGLARGLPILGREGCLQSDEPDVHAAFPGTGLSRTIHHVGVDGIAESGLVLLGNRAIGLGRELDLEGTVRTGPGRTMSDFLSRRRREGSPPVMPAQPGRKAHLPDHAVLDLSVIDGGPGVGHGRPANLDLAVEHGRLGRGVHRYLELGTLVLLHGNRGGTARRIRALDLDAHSAHESVTRSSEAPVEGPIVVGTVLEPGDLLVVAVAEDHREVTIGDHLVVVVLLIDAVRNPLVADGLAGTVEAAVGKEDRTLVRPALAVVIIHVIGIGRGKGLSLVRDKKGKAGTPGLYFEKPVGIGTGGLELEAAVVAFALPGTDRRPLDGFARDRVEHETLQSTRTVAGTHDERKVAHPKARITHSILLLAELRVMTGEKKIGTGLQVLGGINLLDPFLEIIGRGRSTDHSLRGCLLSHSPLRR